MKRILIFCIILNIIFLFGCTINPQLQGEKFVVSFDTNGGEPIESIKATAGEVIGLPIPTKEGYYFTGWEFEDEKGLYQYKIDKHITFKAGWMQKVDKLKYTVSFDTDGGEEIEPVQVEYNSEYKLPTPKKEGYYFVGWTLNGEFIGKSYLIKNDVTFTAVWKDLHLNCYVVWLEMYEGDFGEEYYVEKNTYFTFPTPTKEGYTFTGWEYEGNPVGDKYLITRNISFRATWEKNITKYVVSFDTSGGEEISQVIVEENTIFSLPTPKKEGYIFTGWNYNGEGPYYKYTITQDMTFVATWTKNEESQNTKWELNKDGFDGQGMNYVIKVSPVSKYDPFNNDYTSDDKAIKQAHQKLVEDAYNVKIVYSEWEDEAPWGPERVKFIRQRFADSSFQKKNVYAIGIESQWIPTLVNANCLAQLYNYNLADGIFKEYDYEQDQTINEMMSVRRKVYGYNPGVARPDTFMYYNIDKVAEIGIEDPAELWFKGEWTWSTFDQWVRDAQIKLAAGEYALDLGYADFIMGAAPAQGNVLVNSNRGTLNFTKEAVTKIVDKMTAYYQEGYWDKAHGVQDVSAHFKAGKTLLHSGSLWFLKESTRFTPAEEYGGIQFKIGMVPYPLADDGLVIVKTAPYTFIDTEGNEVYVDKPIYGRNHEVLTTSSGEAIYGIDLSESTFLMPHTGAKNFSIMNYQDKGFNGISSYIAFSILHDLQSAIAANPKDEGLTSDDIYRTYLNGILDQQLDVEVVMSVQDPSLSYYELLDLLSITVGNGSHFGPNGFIPLMSDIMCRVDTPATILGEVEEVYLEALRGLGY